MKKHIQKFIGLLTIIFTISYSSTAQEIGDFYQGGYIFYIDETGKHGLIAAKNYLDGMYAYGCENKSIKGANGKVIDTGYQNTMDIINQDCKTQNGDITAAQAALDYEFNGFDDWYLPSIQELEQMYKSIGVDYEFNGKNILQDKFNSVYDQWYWSSSEISDTTSFSYNFRVGFDNHYMKKGQIRVRPIRSF